MKSPTKNNKVDSLLSTIRQTPPAAEPPPAIEPPKTEPAPPTAAKIQQSKAPRKSIASGSQFWLHDEDRKLIRELYAWLAGQGERPNDSLVVRAALRLVKADAKLLQTYREVRALDGRHRGQG